MNMGHVGLLIKPIAVALHEQLPRSAIFEIENSFTAEAQRTLRRRRAKRGRRKWKKRGEKERKDVSLPSLFLFPQRFLSVLCASAVKRSHLLNPYGVK